jgi:CheY-like chemotaxis protein
MRCEPSARVRGRGVMHACVEAYVKGSLVFVMTGTTKESFEAENKAMQAKLDAGGRRNGKAFAASIDKPFNVAVVEKLLAQLTSQSAPAGEEDGKDKKEKSVAKSVARESSSKIVAREGSQKRVLRILVVEDHWANQKLLEAMLKQHGHEVRCCENGMEAVNLTSSVEFDLILMDCNMPVLDGFEATIKIRARQGLNERVAIIAVTANAMTGDRDKCMSAGMDDYITKPVQRQKLHALIAKWTGVDSSTPVRTMGDSPKDRFGRARPDSSHPGMAPSEVPSGGGSTPTGRSTPTPRSPRRGPNQQAQVQRAGAAGGAGAVKPRILLVDDDNTLRLLVKSRLQKDNSIVIDAGDGEEALVKFKQSKPDIVISDVFMPKMDGFELCRQVPAPICSLWSLSPFRVMPPALFFAACPCVHCAAAKS